MERAREELASLGVRRAMIQLPDGLRYKYEQFSREVGVETELWGGSCYGACDLPWSIGDADALVHVGHSEIPSLKTDYPVIYVEGRSIVENPFSVEVLQAFAGKKVALYSTLQFMDQRDEIGMMLEEIGAETVMREGDGRIRYPGQVLGCNYSCRTRADEHLFVGTGKFHPMGLSMSLKKAIHHLDPCLGTHETTGDMLERTMRKRFAAITLSEDAGPKALLVSKKGGQNRLSLAKEVKSKCDGCVVVHMDEITPDMVDSLGFRVAINTACPRLALDDSLRFKTIMLTPQEHAISVKERTWDEWTMDEIV